MELKNTKMRHGKVKIKRKHYRKVGVLRVVAKPLKILGFKPEGILTTPTLPVVEVVKIPSGLRKFKDGLGDRQR